MRLTGKRCQCVACEEYFSTVPNFDRHRTGEYGRDRRCMTADELRAKGMQKDASGVWRAAPRVAA